MFNSRAYYNSRPDGFAVLELGGGDAPDAPRRFAPLTRTELTGTVTGPLAALRLAQTFALAGPPDAPPVEALYRFPLPGDAAVTGVRVRFGDVEVQTVLKERPQAEADYAAAKRAGRQAARLTRESPDVFTLAVAGITPGQEVRVETAYAQVARAGRTGWSLRVPLTTAPRYVRDDEANSRHAAGQPLAVLRDPGHRFALDLVVRGGPVSSPTHPLAADGDRVRLRDGDVIPDRDLVLEWAPAAAGHPPLSVWAEPDAADGRAYFLALCVPPAGPGGAEQKVSREVVLLVDHSGSMDGAKWEAADWAVERFLAGLTGRDRFALGVFHNTTRWLVKEPTPATGDAVRAAVDELRAARDQGGTELGVALEQALRLPRTGGEHARHVLIVTDAEVTDVGRLLRLVDAEADRPDRRRVSVLCVDAAPNAALATELAERGGGVSRFLTSDPAENDVTTALEEVLADWAAPEHAGLALEVDRAGAEAVGRAVTLRVPGPAAAVDLGDPPAGRAVWVAGRAPLDGKPLRFTLTAGGTALAAATADPTAGDVPGLKALFGADRVRRLEYLTTGGQSGDELLAALQRIGYDAGDAAGLVYGENARAAGAEAAKRLLVREALRFGLPSAETAFVAVRSEAGRPVGETLVVANALPAGWSGITRGGSVARAAAPMPAMALRDAATVAPPRPGGPGGSGGLMAKLFRAFAPPPAAPPEDDTPASSRKLIYSLGATPPAAADAPDDDADEMIACAAPMPAAGGSAASARLTSRGPLLVVAVPAGRYIPGNGAALFDSVRDAAAHPLPPAGRLTSLSVTPADAALTPAAVGDRVTLLLMVGDDPDPRARVRLADVLGGGRRPLNVRWAAGQAVRLVVDDPDGRWAAGAPPLTVALGWDVA